MNDGSDQSTSSEHPEMERSLSVAVVTSSTGPALVKGALELVNWAAAAISVSNPNAGLAVQTVALLGGWAWSAWRLDRVRPALVAIANRIQSLQNEYVKKEEFADFLWDGMRRLSEQPEPPRQRLLRSIMLNVMNEPREHTENRLFLRLADELSVQALEMVLTEMSQRLDRHQHAAQIHGFDSRTDVFEELTAAGLLKRNVYTQDDDGRDLPALNTRGVNFINFARETD